MGAITAAALPRGDVYLRRTAEAREPELLPLAESDLDPGPAHRRLAHEPSPRPVDPPDRLRQADRPRDRLRRGGDRRWRAPRSVDPHRRDRRRYPVLQPVLD